MIETTQFCKVSVFPNVRSEYNFGKTSKSCICEPTSVQFKNRKVT